ncbi:MAG: hypothetical protein Q4B67_08780, partial [Eubacteriales bacterium]|nr:hypothetical protein [Eubacteriales bacterium]
MIKYNILDPKGNITILVETAVKVSSQSFVAAKLMELEPEAEQVGFVKVCGKNGKPEGKLRMAGGEFCGNATMCTAALKCIKEKFNNKPDILPKRVAVSASGHRGVVYVDVTAGSDGDSYLTRGEMPWPKGFGETVINGIVYPIVHMGGIDHVIIGDEFDDEESKKLIKEACEIENTDAIGFMFIKRSGNKVNSGINGDNGNSGESG